MINLLFYFFVYCNVDTLFNKLFIQRFGTESIQTDSHFYYSLTNVHFFILFIYSIYFIKNYVYYNSINNTSNVLSFIYIKYTLKLFFHDNITLFHYEFSRNIMWLFSTPLMLKMYCDMNNITLKHINAQYHIIPVFINTILYPYKHTSLYYYFISFSWLLLLLFIKTLYTKRNLMFTNVYLFIWFIFMGINLIDLFQLTSIYNIQLYYVLADTLSKVMTCIIVNDFNERKIAQLNTMDLQSLQFIQYIINHITNYKNENCGISPQCNELVDFTKQEFLSRIPQNKIIFEQELLKKLLPFDFDKEYITNSISNTITKSI